MPELLFPSLVLLLVDEVVLGVVDDLVLVLGTLVALTEVGETSVSRVRSGVLKVGKARVMSLVKESSFSSALV